MSCKLLNKCVVCNSTELLEVLDFGTQPLANSYTSSLVAQEKYPLKLNYCKKCTHLQLSHAVDPNVLYNNYVYVSGTAKTNHEYFKSFVDLVLKYAPDASVVLDIACNDGTQLDYFKQRGFQTHGIDPAQNLVSISGREHNVVCDFLTEHSLQQFNKTFDVVIAQNVLAHTQDPKTFLQLCADAITTGYVFIQTSQANMVELGEFDTIYHEHISFFNVQSMTKLANSVGLYVHDVLKPQIHGTSYVFVLSKTPCTKSFDDYPVDINSVVIYKSKVLTRLHNFQQKVLHYKLRGLSVIGYGAPAKAMTLLHASNTALDLIVDDNPLKQDKYCSAGVLVKSSDTLRDLGSGVVIPLAWNFSTEIESKLQKLNTKLLVVDCYE